MTENEILRDLWTASWMSKGQAPSARDTTYWLEQSPGMTERGPQIRYRGQVVPEMESGRAYQFDRMLGWQSGGSDVPPFGKWASPPTAFREVPPFPGDATGVPNAPQPNPTPAPASPESSSDVATVLGVVNGRFDELSARLGRLEAAAERYYTGTVQLPKVIGGGTRTITLHPVVPRGKPGDGA